MAFKIKKVENNDFTTPQEMFQDNKLKSIKGILDYQSQMLDNYLLTLNQEGIVNKNVAFELPTGSGKTLIGVLIAEFHRRKYKRKCLFLCPTNQLVMQVSNQCKNQYGIEAIPFIGKQSEYSTNAKTNYLLGNAIGITTYSSFFAAHSFFKQADILIFDDVHSSESYIVDNWSLNITRDEYPILFKQIVALLKDVIDEAGINRLMSDDAYNSDIMNWNDLLPFPKMLPKIDALRELLSNNTKDTNLSYAWNRIVDNLADCQIYVNWRTILIRPYIPPTETHTVFNNSKQRIFMSATLGYSGELERITGCKKIKRLPIVSDWDKKGLGRRLFIFPDLSLEASLHREIIAELHQYAKHSVTIVPSKTDAIHLSDFFKEQYKETEIYDANDLAESKESFCSSDNAMVIMSNRFDGVDFPDEDSRMLFIYQLPKITHLQEAFFVNKMAASVLYSERIKTRIVQAVGRCTRNASDYSAVCILGSSILNELTSETILATYPPELRAEIVFGINNSTDFKNIDDIIENLKIFYARGADWADADQEIVNQRNQFVKEGKNVNQEKLYEKLFNSAQIEVDIQYELWKKDYQSAYENAIKIVDILNAPALTGYKCYWQYVCACLALRIGNKLKAAYYIQEAVKNNRGSVIWLPNLINSEVNDTNTSVRPNLFYDIISNLEEQMLIFKQSYKFEDKAKAILEGLNSLDGNEFEKAHLELGKMLGYAAYNSKEEGAPDPYWVINDNLCIVAEDKIYEKKEKEIPIKHVKQAYGHETWIRDNELSLNKNAKIITIFISNSSTIEDEARTFAKNIYYVNRENLCKWATKAINTVRTVRSQFSESGDANWRSIAQDAFSAAQASPQDFIDFVTEKKLSEI